MIRVALVRGAYLNAFEGQNYVFSEGISLKGIASRYPLHSQLPFPVISLHSVSDMQTAPVLRNFEWLNAGIKYVGNRILGDSQILFGLERLADRFDIFHTADPHYYYSYQLAQLRKKGRIKKLIVTSWETIPFNNETVLAKKHNKYEVLSAADWFICYTRKAKEVLIQEGVAAERIDVVPLGVDTARFHPNRHRQNTVLTVLFVGRLVTEKGAYLIEEAFRRVQKRVSRPIRLRIVGSGLDYAAMPAVYRDADIFVLPSQGTSTWEEQYGMVLIEAMASGLPIISTQTGAIPEVLGEAGILVPAKNEEHLESALFRLITDVQLRKELGQRAHEKALLLYDSRTTARKIGTIYQRVFDL